MTSATDQCSFETCDRPARIALKTNTRYSPGRGLILSTTIFYDDRQAPKTAQRYCKTHGASMAAELINVTAHEDGV